ncbi:MAG: alpha/beta hydrolase [Verrucomicrobia bacterium]|nr:alpha/beta hydrolase [Verrucomicrobiota bacterium]
MIQPNIISPRVSVYSVPNGVDTLPKVLAILPGGGYGHLAKHEGDGYAQWFASRGVRCYVISYAHSADGVHGDDVLFSLRDDLTCMLQNLSAVMQLQNVKWGIMGSSAGGHLSAVCSTAFQSYQIPRPDFTVLCYPVISFEDDPWTHKGSRDNFLGMTHKDDTSLWRKFSPHLNVNDQTPPAFLWHTADDAPVPAQNSLAYVNALLAVKVPCELHLYPHGRHGLGLETNFPWAEACWRWLNTL